MNIFTFNTVREKFLALALGLSTLLLVAVGMAMGTHNISSIRGMLESKGNATAEFMSKISVNYYANFSYSDLDNLVSEALKDPAVDFAVFYDEQNKPLTKMQKDISTSSSYMTFERKIVSESGLPLGKLKIGYNKSAISATQRKSIIIVTISILIAIILFAFGMSVLVGKVIIQPIGSVEKVAKQIAAGDLTISVDMRGKDEIASLGLAVNSMTVNLKDVISKIRNITDIVSGVTTNISELSQEVMSVSDIQKKAIEVTSSAVADMDGSISQVAANAENLSESSGDASSSMLEMASSISKIAENADLFNETAHETASSIEEMVATIKQIETSLDSLSAVASDIASSIEELNATTREIKQSADESVSLAEAVMVNASDKGMKAASAAIGGMSDIKQGVVALSDTINMLGEKTEDIGKILMVIDDVADQTNLLALNAAILAAHAGEHGRGFAIVADEIKNLAERSSASTGEIASVIRSVQGATSSSIKMASNAVETVEKGLKLVSDVSSALDNILGSSRASTQMAHTIQRAAAAEVQAINQISGAVASMMEQTENIAHAMQEQGKGSRYILEATEKVKDLSGQVNNATREQKEGSRLITKVIENVTYQASQIAVATGRQKEESEKILQSMDKINKETGKLVGSSEDMNAVITSLKTEAMKLQAELQKFKI